VSSIFLNACISRIQAEDEGLDKNGYIFNRLDGDEVKTVYKEPQYWLHGDNESTYLANYLKYTGAKEVRQDG
jgi:hypothetical protein